MKTWITLALMLAAQTTLAATPPGGTPKMLPQTAIVSVTSTNPALASYAAHASVPMRKPWYTRLLEDARAGHFSADAMHKQVSIEGTTELQFEVAPDGKVSKVILVTGSGLRSLDDSAVGALADLVLPPLPDGSNAAPQSFHGRFKVAKTSESGLIEYLETLQKKHLF